jgi:hypothetical protein
MRQAMNHGSSRPTGATPRSFAGDGVAYGVRYASNDPTTGADLGAGQATV